MSEEERGPMQLYTVKEAADVLNLSPATVYALVAARKIRHERLGMGRRAIRVPHDAIDEYRRKMTVGAEESAPEKPARRRVTLRHLEG